MQRIKMMTDSASDLPRESAQELGIDIIPISIAVDGQGYLEGSILLPVNFTASCSRQRKSQPPRRSHRLPTVNIITERTRRDTPMLFW